MIKILILSYILMISSCSSFNQTKTVSENLVELEISDKDKQLNIDDQTKQFDQVYGPSFKDLNQNTQEVKTPSPIVAIHLAPAGMQISGYLSLFNELESRNIKINIISGEGLSTIIAALYAKYQNSAMLEWKLYELFGKIKNSQFLSNQWKIKLKDFLEEEFKDTKMNQLSSLLIFPLEISGELKLVDDYLIIKGLMSSLEINPKQYNSSLLNEKVDYSDFISKKFNPDIIIQVGIYTNDVSFKESNVILRDIYSKKLTSLSKKSEFFLNLENLNFPLDQVNNISVARKRTASSAKSIVNKIEEKIIKWKNSNN